jgi:hypothetical protein
MQKTVYRIRTRQTISRRIALDMQRDLQAPARHQTTAFLRQQRRETGQNDSVTLLQSHEMRSSRSTCMSLKVDEIKTWTACLLLAIGPPY